MHAELVAIEEATRRGDHSGDAGADRRLEREASGDGLRRQMANPVIPSVTTMVCVTCGAEQFFDGQVPAGLKCQRCGSMVFRAFDTKRLPLFVGVTLLSSAVGAYLVTLLPAEAMSFLIAFFMLGVAVFVVLNRRAGVTPRAYVSRGAALGG